MQQYQYDPLTAVVKNVAAVLKDQLSHQKQMKACMIM